MSLRMIRRLPSLALKGPSTYACQCLLIEQDQTCRGRTLTAEFDPNATWLRFALIAQSLLYRYDLPSACGTKSVGYMHDRSQLVGTWRMLTWRREFADTGERIDALGAAPVGFVSYGVDGRVNAIVLKRDRPSPTRLPPSDSEKLELFESMLAYAGTYTLHDDHVVHHVDASWNQAFTGTDLIRFYKLHGSKLEIWGAPAPDPYTGRTVVHRMTFEKWAFQP